MSRRREIRSVISIAVLLAMAACSTAEIGREVATGGAWTRMADGAAYDPATDRWRALPDLPGTGHTDVTGIVWTGVEVVLVGLATEDGGRALTVAVDPARGTIRTLDDLPSTPEELGSRQAHWAGDDVLVVSMPFTEGAGAIVDRLEPEAGDWDETIATPAHLVGQSAWAGDRLVLLGSPTVVLLDPVTGDQERLDRPQGDPGDFPLVAIDDDRVAVGDHWLDVPAGAWHATSDLPRGIRNNPVGVGDDGRMYVWGGDGCLDLCGGFVDPGPGLVWVAP